MNNNNHPTYSHHQDFTELCKPLQKLGIDYFSYVTVHDGIFCGVSNNPSFQQHYLGNQYYNVDIHLAAEGFVKDYAVWDSIECTGLSSQMNTEAAEFGVRHTFTMIEKNNGIDHYFHFSTSIDTQWNNQTYLSNLDLLKLFNQYFTHHVQRSPALRRFQEFTFGLNVGAGSFATSANTIIQSDSQLREDFLREMNMANQFKLSNGATLTVRHLEILYWLHLGKTIRDIACILQIADITVNKHIAEMKNKLGCYTQFQLGEYFAKLFASHPEFINRMTRLRKSG